MTLTIYDTTMTSDRTAHTARHAPSRNGWEVSWLPGQILDGNTAVTAMLLADVIGKADLHEGHRIKPADSPTGRPLTDQRDTCAGQITA